jgi:hypothetical protein
MLTTLLVYPPFVSDSRAFPPLSLPALKAYLASNGYPAHQLDINIACYQHLTQGSVLEELNRHLSESVANYQWVTHSLDELSYFCTASDAVTTWLPHFQALLSSNHHNLKVLPSAECQCLLDKVTTLVLLQRRNKKPLLEMTTAELLDEVQGGPESILRAYLREIATSLVSRSNPDVVGMSLMVEHQLFPGLLLAHYLKHVKPSVHIVFGGGFISAVADKIGAVSNEIFSLVDSFIPFDGEHALLELLRALESGRPLKVVDNLIHQDKTLGTVHHNPVRETGSLDELPIPDFDGIQFNQYTRNILPYYVSKGCSFGRCAYCSDPAYSTPRDRSPSRAVDEIEQLITQHRPETLLFVDSYIHPQRMEPIAREIIRRGLSVKWLTQTRMDRFLTTERIEVFAASGCSELWFGMETVNQRMIRLIRKGSKKDIITRILADCCRYGIKVTLNCMIGFPTETEIEAQDTLAFVEELHSLYPDLIFKCNTGFVFVPRLSPFGKEPSKFGITVVDEFEWSPRLEWIPPEWRYQERFQTLDHEVFANSYGAMASAMAHTSTTPTITMDSTFRCADNIYFATSRVDIISLWKRYFHYNRMLLAEQREHRCTKERAKERINRLIAEDNALRVAFERPGRYAFVIDDGTWRSIAPVTFPYERLIQGIRDCESVYNVVDRVMSWYPHYERTEVEQVVVLALGHLARCKLLHLDRHEEHRTADESPTTHLRRKNFGQMDSQTTEDQDSEAPSVDTSAPDHLIQIQIQSTRTNCASVH